MTATPIKQSICNKMIHHIKNKRWDMVWVGATLFKSVACLKIREQILYEFGSPTYLLKSENSAEIITGQVLTRNVT